MEADNSERIDRFLREEMTPEENAAFLSDLQTDSALRDQAQRMALMIEELREQQAQRDAAIIEEVVATRIAERKARMVRMVKWGSAVAAVLVVAVGLYLARAVRSEEKDYIALAEKYYTEAPLPTVRSGDTDADKELETLFRQVGEDDDVHTAAQRLQYIYDHLDEEYAYTANGNDVRIAWYLALAYLKDGNPDKSIPLLQAISKDDRGTDLGEPASKLLKDINDE